MRKKLRSTIKVILKRKATPNDDLKIFQKAQFKPIKEVKAEQWTKLKELLNHAFTNVPYYREKWIKAGITPADIKTLKDFLKIPYTTKEELRAAGKNALAQNLPKERFRKSLTSGSTGYAWKYYNDTQELLPENIAWMNQINLTGYKGGPWVRFRNEGPTKSWLRNVYFYQLGSIKWIKATHMALDNVGKLLDKIMSFNPEGLQTFPQQLESLILHMKKNNLSYTVPIIFIEGGRVDPELFIDTEKLFHGKMFREYGFSECMRICFQCKERNGYHIDMTRFYLEIMRGGKPDKSGEIVVTNLNNWVMPLIRYRPKDSGVSETKKCSCGRSWPRIKEIKGRVFEVLYDKKGLLVNDGPIKEAIYSLVEAVTDWQIIQKKDKTVVVKIVPGPGYDSKVPEKIRKIVKKLGKLDIDVKKVKSLPRYGAENKKFAIRNEGETEIA